MLSSSTLDSVHSYFLKAVPLSHFEAQLSQKQRSKTRFARRTGHAASAAQGPALNALSGK